MLQNVFDPQNYMGIPGSSSRLNSLIEYMTTDGVVSPKQHVVQHCSLQVTITDSGRKYRQLLVMIEAIVPSMIGTTWPKTIGS